MRVPATSHQHRLRWLALLALLPLVAGCSAGPSSSLSGGLSIQASKDSRASGTPIALVPVHLSKSDQAHVPKDLQIYSLTYWSRGLRCQAYLDVPGGPGSHPLWVLLHGAWVWSQPNHYSGFPVNTTSYAAMTSEPDAITFLPNYGGYGPSQGDVGDSHDDYVDVMNGLKALGHITGLHVKRDATYLSGASLGGIVALMTAVNDSAVRAVTLLSPWPGASEALSWLQAQPTNTLTGDDLSDDLYLVPTCGPNLQSLWCKENSVPYQELKVPILIVGGTHDTNIVPGMLQAMSTQLRRYNAQVELRMVPGGHAPETTASWAIEQAWLAAHGLRLQ